MHGLLETVVSLNPTQTQAAWLDKQREITTHISGDAQDRAKLGQESLYGLPMADILRAIPAAAGLSSYVSLGMSRISAKTLAGYLARQAFQYRASKAGAIRPYNGKLYVSGIPECYLDIDGAPIPAGFPIVSLIFEKDPTSTPPSWRVTIRQSMRPPKPA